MSKKAKPFLSCFPCGYKKVKPQSTSFNNKRSPEKWCNNMAKISEFRLHKKFDK